MPIIVPPPLNLAFQLYGIAWPDIDEDKVAEFGEAFDKLCEATADYGRAVDGLLTVLSDRSESEAFTAVASQWSEVHATTLFPVLETAGDAVRIMAEIGRAAVTSYKVTLIGILTTNIAADLAAMAVPGPGTAVATARIATVRVILPLALWEVAKHYAGFLVKEIREKVEEAVLGPIERLFREVREAIVVQFSDSITENSPVRRGTLRTAGALYIDFADVIDATTKLSAETHALLDAIDSWVGYLDAEEYEEPDYNQSGNREFTVRAAVKEILGWLIKAAAKLVRDIAEAVMTDLITLITDTYEKYVEADQKLAAQARALRESFHLRPAVMPYIIDRTSMPKPIMIWENPPEEVFTGEAVSAARFDIELIDLVDAPDAVVTGLAESDARFDINIIDLPDAPDPVVTGPAVSDARFDIKVIDLRGGAKHRDE